MKKRLLQAARRIVLRRGFDALTNGAVEAESGASRSLIHYHFGGKAGLVAALLDSAFHEIKETAHDREAQGDGPRAFAAGMALSRRTSADRTAWHLFAELLPHMLRSRHFRSVLANEYEADREWASTQLQRYSDLDDDSARDMACVMVAVVDGLGLQHLVDEKSVDLPRVYALWESVIRSLFRFPEQSEAADEPETDDDMVGRIQD
jgi:TetR/AcrR family transcriptional regulator, regulator of biofilm formation and stress response